MKSGIHAENEENHTTNTKLMVKIKIRDMLRIV
jgi:hypothetical protein